MGDLSFPTTEFGDRLSKILSAMNERGMDVLILTRAENIFYASGFRASHFASWLSELHAVIIPKNGELRLMTRALEREAAKHQWTEAPHLYMDDEDPYTALRKIISEMGNAKEQLELKSNS